MFERFTEEGRRTVVLAQEEARALLHNYIGTEHLLLGLLRMREGVAAEVLESFGVSADDVHGQVLRIVGRGEKEPGDQIPFTPRSKKVLELSLREALQLGHQEITGGHLLLALLREGEGVAVLGLTQLGVDLPAVRARVLESLPPASDEPPPPRRRFFRRGGGDPVEPGLSAIPVWPVERLDDHAWDALVEARGTARQRGAETIGTIDLLAGIAAMGGSASDTLRTSGIDLDVLDDAVLGVSGEPDAAPLTLPLARPLRDALARAFDEAHQRGHGAVTAAHMLFGLLADPDPELLALLDDLDVVIPNLRAEAARRIEEL
jgi:ATP-dependent Clp protease ATP-binding subunit ClpA